MCDSVCAYIYDEERPNTEREMPANWHVLAVPKLCGDALQPSNHRTCRAQSRLWCGVKMNAITLRLMDIVAFPYIYIYSFRKSAAMRRALVAKDMMTARHALIDR